MKEELGIGGLDRRDWMRTMFGAGMALAGGSLFPGLASAATETPKKGGHIRVALDSASATDTLDPAAGSSGSDYVRFFMFYNGLTILDSSLTPHMNMAESITTTDAKTWIVKLRTGVTFHNGKSLKPEDVVFSLMRHKNPATASRIKPLAEQFSDVKATGPSEVTITLVSPNADLPAILAIPQFVIVQDGTTNFANGIGTGPYKLGSFKPGVSTIGVRNENYWKPGQPYLDQIELIGISEPSARLNALLAGDVHLIAAVDPRSTARVDSTPGYRVLETKSGMYSDLIMRVDDPMTGNADFVNGMKYLFDRKQIQENIFRGRAVIANDQPIPPGHRYFNPELKPKAYDLDKAKFFFQKAGAVGATLPPIYATAAANGSVEMAQFLQQSAAKIGVTLNVNRVPAEGYWSNHWMKHPLGFGNINPRPTADALLTQFFRSDAPWNETGWKNADFDRILQSARGETDEGKRKQMYGELQQLISEKDGIGIPCFISLLDGIDKRVKGIGSVPTGQLMGFGFAEFAWWDA